MGQFIIIGIVLFAGGVSSQIHTKLHKDGYHYDVPDIDVRFDLPTTKRPVEIVPTLPPLPSFLPQINLPKVIPVRPLPVKPDIPVQPRTQPVIVQPAPFSPVQSLPVKPENPLPVQPRINLPTATLSPNEYLPPRTLAEESEWEAWKRKYNKRYDTLEEDYRRKQIFEDNVHRIHLHNADFSAGLVTFDLDINKFSDLTQQEFVVIHTGIRRKTRAAQSPVRFYDAPYPSRSGFSADEINLLAGSGSGSISGQNGFGSSNQFSGSSNRFSGSPNQFSAQNGFQSSNQFSGSSNGFGSSNQFSGSSNQFSGSPNQFSGSPNQFSGASNQLDSSLSAAAEAQRQNMMNVFMASPELDSEVKDEVDWRREGAITPVKNQGKCASCWAFSSAGCLEAHNFLRKRTGPIPLSEQNLIDCVKENDGCDGGYMTNAFEYVIRNPGIDTESSYPYEARNSTCRFSPNNIGGECRSYMEIQIGNEQALKQAVATVGPVAAGIDGGQHSFQFYKSGFYFEPKCEQEVNHALVIVGYGKTEKGEEYWIGKNSWDTDWGEEGYIRMARNRNNHCGIASLASYPIV